METPKEGLLIAFDGIDSSGKATHTQELVRRLRFNGHTAHFFQTPDYTTKTGQQLKQLLQNPTEWQAMPWTERMKIFAANRSEHKEEVMKALERGEYVIYDRYIPSSLAFFTVEALIADRHLKRQEIQKHIAEHEYTKNEMPKEHVSIFLDVPVEVSRGLLEKRQKTQSDKAEYTDQMSIQQKMYNEYDLLCSAEPEHYLRIKCVEGSELLPVPDIAELVWEGLLHRFPKINNKE